MGNIMPKCDPKIHIRLPEDLHAKLRVKCAFEGQTIQDLVSKLIEKAVKDVLLPYPRKPKKK